MSWSSLESLPRRRPCAAIPLPVAVHASRQNVAAQIGDAVIDGAPDFGRKRQHGAQHFAERRQVVLRGPLGELQQMIAEQRLLVEHGLKILDLDVGWGLGVERPSPRR